MSAEPLVLTTTGIERRPIGREWAEVSNHLAPRGEAMLGVSTWSDGRLLVISTLVEAELPDGSGRSGPQWHISISRGRGKRAKDHEIRRALRAFRMTEADEDNHEPGAARHFWLPVDPSVRVECECKTTEYQVIEKDGHRWSNTTEPGECRGCEYERMFGRACPIHGEPSRLQKALPVAGGAR